MADSTAEWVAWLESQNKQLNTELADALDEVDRLRRLIIEIERVCIVALPD